MAIKLAAQQLDGSGIVIVEANDKQKQSGTPVTDMTGDEQTKTQTGDCNAVKLTHIKLSCYFIRTVIDGN
jgi:hypothetical protein